MSVQPVESELTTEQAADLLNVPHAFLVGLLEQGAIPVSAAGRRRRLRRGDVLSYQEQHRQMQDAALDEMAEIAQRAGAYE